MWGEHLDETELKLDLKWYYGLCYPYICQPIHTVALSVVKVAVGRRGVNVFFSIENWWQGHIAWRIAHHVAGERCENCHNWHERKTKHVSRWGWCDLISPVRKMLEHYHGWCPMWEQKQDR